MAVLASAEIRDRDGVQVAVISDNLASIGQSAFAVTPRNFFDDDGGTAATIDAAHGVQQEDKKSP